jgi:hypothetical protein
MNKFKNVFFHVAIMILTAFFTTICINTIASHIFSGASNTNIVSEMADVVLSNWEYTTSFDFCLLFLIWVLVAFFSKSLHEVIAILYYDDPNKDRG